MRVDSLESGKNIRQLAGGSGTRTRLSRYGPTRTSWTAGLGDVVFLDAAVHGIPVEGVAPEMGNSRATELLETTATDQPAVAADLAS
jgi:hypothetical protein